MKDENINEKELIQFMCDALDNISQKLDDTRNSLKNTLDEIENQNFKHKRKQKSRQDQDENF
jgi:hypothetical protein